jgi:ribonuclease HI
MDLTTPHYLLFSQVDRANGTGRWSFVLRTADGAQQIEADDVEPGILAERLDLLTIVRALEALDQPSHVTVVDCSDYLWKGVHYGLPEWRDNGWRWEFFGQMVPVKNSDLWQRLDRALQFHEVECRRRRFDMPHNTLSGGSRVPRRKKRVWGLRDKLSNWLKCAAAAIPLAWRRCLDGATRA